MIYSKKDREIIKKRIIELLKENGQMSYTDISNTILKEGLSRTHQVVGQILHTGCSTDEKFKGEDIFENLKYGLWTLSQKKENSENS